MTLDALKGFNYVDFKIENLPKDFNQNIAKHDLS